MIPRIPSLEQQFFNHRNIQDSYQIFFKKNSSKSIRRADINSLDFHEFHRYHDKFINLALRAIRNGSWTLQPSRQQIIFADKQRIISRFTFLDQFILLHLAACLQSELEQDYPASVHSYRKKHSNINALKLIATFIQNNSGPLFIIKRDISDYGASINHDLAIESISKLTEPGEVILKMLNCIFKHSIITETGDIKVSTCGLPTGTHLQLVFENVYLFDLDRELQSLSPALYLRFGDDMIFISPSKEIAEQAASAISSELAKKELLINKEKSSDSILVKPADNLSLNAIPGWRKISHFQHLGLQIAFDGTLRLNNSKIKRLHNILRSRLKSALKLLPAEAANERKLKLLIRTIQNLLQQNCLTADSKLANYLHAIQNQKELKELDLWLALQIINLAYGCGFKKSAFRHCSYHKLRQLGLPSFIHLLRTHEL